MKSVHIFIGGRAVEGSATWPVINPATEQVVSQCPRADLAQLNAAVAAAKAAFPAWSQTSIEARRALLMKIADGVEARGNEIAEMLTLEQGKPLPHAQGEVAGSVLLFPIRQP